MIKIDLCFLVISLSCIVSLTSCTEQVKRDPFDKYIFKKDEEKLEILKKCYKIIVDWQEGYTIDPELSEIMKKNHNLWTTLEKITIINVNTNMNNDFRNARCNEIFISDLRAFGVNGESEESDKKDENEESDENEDHNSNNIEPTIVPDEQI